MHAACALLFATVASISGCEAPAADIEPGWFACRRNRDCAIVDDPTCAFVPINKRYAKGFVQWITLHHPFELSREPCAAPPIEYAPRCEDARCSSRPVLPRRDDGVPSSPARNSPTRYRTSRRAS